MKKKSLYLLGIALYSVLFSGCEWTVDMEEMRPAPRLVLNSVVRTGEPVTARVSRTWFFTEENPNVVIPDAEVSLHINGQYVETLAWTEGDKEKNEQGYYQAAYTPKAGDRIALTAAREGYVTVSAEVVVPVFAPVFKVEDRITGILYDGDIRFNAERQLRVTFKDNPGEKNYYMFFCEIEYYAKDSTDNMALMGWDYLNASYEDEPLFSGQKNGLEEIVGYDRVSGRYGRVFTDEQINGKEYTLRLPNINSAFEMDYIYNGVEGDYGHLPNHLPNDILIDTIISPIRHYRVSLQTISESYYRYMKALIEMEDTSLHGDLIDVGLAEPISIYSNINNGLGILGACSGQSVTLELSTKKE
ncbi:MAG: DUF4249 domain-containing protein [Tannerellaceae bacterium]|nr:DUF4249 domain-containing protein [Tannerellaceae bacterium]